MRVRELLSESAWTEINAIDEEDAAEEAVQQWWDKGRFSGDEETAAHVERLFEEALGLRERRR